jgi:hypothetical protein
MDLKRLGLLFTFMTRDRWRSWDYSGDGEFKDMAGADRGATGRGQELPAPTALSCDTFGDVDLRKN